MPTQKTKVIYDNPVPDGGRIRITNNIYFLPAACLYTFDPTENKWTATLKIDGEEQSVIEFWYPSDLPEIEIEHFSAIVFGMTAAFTAGMGEGKRQVQAATKNFFRGLTGEGDLDPFLNASDEVED